uniref:NAD(P)H nitroreductase n=1 Tax=Nocardia neocaledoniensis TaxID=236511 RepID=UPI00245827B9
PPTSSNVGATIRASRSPARSGRPPRTAIAPTPVSGSAAAPQAGGAHGAVVRRIDDRGSLRAAAQAAVRAHAGDESYRFELAMWSGRHGSVDGVPARNTPVPRPDDELPARLFAGAEFTDPATEPDHADLLVIGTPADDRASRLRAGEAISSVLLTATGVGLATCLLTEPLEIPEQRAKMRERLLHDLAYPQAVLRVGWAPTSAGKPPETPRRPLAELLVSDDDAVAPSRR